MTFHKHYEVIYESRKYSKHIMYSTGESVCNLLGVNPFNWVILWLQRIYPPPMFIHLRCVHFSDVNTISLMEIKYQHYARRYVFWKQLTAELTFLQLPTSSRVKGWSALMEDQLYNNIVENYWGLWDYYLSALSCLVIPNLLISLTLYTSRIRHIWW